MSSPNADRVAARLLVLGVAASAAGASAANMRQGKAPDPFGAVIHAVAVMTDGSAEARRIAFPNDAELHPQLTPCDNQAVIYLSTNTTLSLHEEGPLHLTVEGQDGVKQFTFASGTTQANIVDAVNYFTETLGLNASVSSVNPARVQFVSTIFGPEGHVRLIHEGGTWNLLSPTPFGWVSSNDLRDVGRDGIPGDADCNFVINYVDLQIVLDGWGQCEVPPASCMADMNIDGKVNVDDLLIVINRWGDGDQT